MSPTRRLYTNISNIPLRDLEMFETCYTLVLLPMQWLLLASIGVYTTNNVRGGLLHPPPPKYIKPRLKWLTTLNNYDWGCIYNHKTSGPYDRALDPIMRVASHCGLA